MNKLLHGGDYNPDQWLDRPDILQQDIELMKKANINCVSIGIFAWAKLEPREGEYDFDWLERIINRLYENGISSLLATPSGSKPLWMSERYEKIRRVADNGVRDHSGLRHNHCMTSPVYRELVRKIDTALAERFAHNPAVIMWHIGNEFGGECFCPLCRAAFRDWVRRRYNGSIEAVNHAWWADFWSHTYTDFEQIQPPLPNGEHDILGLNIDWKRFMTDQTVDFIKCEIDAVKSVNPDIPATTNLMGFHGYNYFKLRDVVDIVSWDSYSEWHHRDNGAIAADTACAHDLMRGIKPNQPFLLMESTPSTTNWQPVSKLKRPHMHEAASLQAIAHGSDSVQYFQIRKSRGSVEKFHGAVIDHYGGENRVFREVAALGQKLSDISQLKGSVHPAQVAIIFDFENRWAIDGSQGPRNCGMNYDDAIHRHHRAFWEMGINTDIVDMESDLSGYRLVIAPMLYMYRAGIEQRLREFVEQGGTLVGTYHSGIVNENDLCLLGELPGGGMNEVFGIWNEETDSLYDGEYNRLVMTDGSEYKLRELCALLHTTSAETLGVYGDDFYKGTPALTRNSFGQGSAYYIAAAAEDRFYREFYDALCDKLGLIRALGVPLPKGMSAHRRVDGEQVYIFVENYSGVPLQLALGREYKTLDGKAVSSLDFLDYEVKVLLA